ncbi:hypothetical protein AB6A40_011718 [Gnathostoma spinigerum]|uniref:Uncharacterized protein n=1 Tax=Gnathostoma spinigerum TaxID=75299 RepID=A0ABD6F3V9_9BILA
MNIIIFFKITKKCEAAEKERNDAVIRYATREAEIMKLTDSRSKIVKELDTVREKLSQLEKSISMKNVDDLKQTISERQKELEAERLLKAEIETELKMALKRINVREVLDLTVRYDLLISRC